MGVNCDKPTRWKADIAASVDLYNSWFLEFTPSTFRETRIQTTAEVQATLAATDNLTDFGEAVLRRNPSILPTLRMSTCPPIARDRLIGLASVSKNLVLKMEKQGTLPPRMRSSELTDQLTKIAATIVQLADHDIMTWLDDGHEPDEEEVHRAATVIADRLCGATADPIVRNAQEARQLEKLAQWLQSRGYTELAAESRVAFDKMSAGTFAFRRFHSHPCTRSA